MQRVLHGAGQCYMGGTVREGEIDRVGLACAADGEQCAGTERAGNRLIIVGAGGGCGDLLGLAGLRDDAGGGCGVDEQMDIGSRKWTLPDSIVSVPSSGDGAGFAAGLVAGKL
jgi:hypothetical protein